MNENFDRSFEFAMSFEGYKSEDENDPGGRTIFGISERSFPDVVVTLWPMSYSDARSVAKEFYRNNFWYPADCNFKKWPWDIYIFDTAVNLGLDRTKSMTEDAICLTPEDILMLRIEHYINLAMANKEKYERYLKGWIRRVVQLWKLGGSK